VCEIANHLMAASSYSITLAYWLLLA